MPAGRPPLDPEIKHQRRQESLKRYAAKNADILRRKAKARIVWAKIAQMDWKEKKQHRTRVAEDSERYRDRQDQKEREKREYMEARSSLHRHVKCNILREAHGLLPLPPNPHGPRAPHRDEAIRNPRRERSARTDKGMKCWKAFHRRQPAMTLPEPNNNNACTASDDSDDNPSTHCAATPPIYEGGMTASTCAFAPARCPECNCEGCPGCICMCPALTDWIKHADGEGHFFPTCIESFGSPPYNNGPLLCIPIYSTDAGHEDWEAHTGGFFAVIHDNWKGAVTSHASLTRTLNRYPGAPTFSVFTWSRFLDLWALDCREYHEHEGETPEVRARAALRVRQHLRGIAHYERLVAADKEIRVEEEAKWAEEEARWAEEEAKRVEEEAKRVKREEMAYLAATRPPPVPLSPQRARQLFDCVLGLGAGSPPPSMLKMRAEPASPGNGNPAPTATAPQTPPITPPQTPVRIAAFDDYAHMPTTRLSGLPPYTDAREFETHQAPALYAVHTNGHNRVFNNRARAVEVLRDTPVGELVFVGDEQNLWRFLNDQ
ncbi:hypothetical protein B0H14DRAFT_3444608 [Mycena olivaceomarginata]|nr:hypothetical protein B0H14DRAFT_3444608 [Mycena olivaceomarginata]